MFKSNIYVRVDADIVIREADDTLEYIEKEIEKEYDSDISKFLKKYKKRWWRKEKTREWAIEVLDGRAKFLYGDGNMTHFKEVSDSWSVLRKRVITAREAAKLSKLPGGEGTILVPGKDVHDWLHAANKEGDMYEF